MRTAQANAAPRSPHPRPAAERRLGERLECDGGEDGARHHHAHARLPVEDSVESYGGDLELAAGLALKVHGAAAHSG